MNIEENRLALLENWSDVSGISAQEIAAAGFYATRNGNEVQCYWCMEKVNSWQEGDNALEKHRQISPGCPFIVNPRYCGNIPIASDIDFQDEATRLATYQSWPVSFIEPTDLARAGFYYINRSDQVKCAWCHRVIGEWEVSDDPVVEHLKFSPTCPKALSLTEASEVSDQDIGIQPVKPPKFPNYVTLASRIRSFANWKIDHIQDPTTLAESGFYYCGNDDQVMCFHCGGGLFHWEEKDQPWYEHARWFPTCPFLQLLKGPQYVQKIQERHKNDPQAKARQQQKTTPVQPTMTLDQAMDTEPVQACLQMGLSIGRIKSLTKRHLEATGRPYETTQALAESILDDQREAECDDDERAANSRISLRSVVANTLWSVLQASSSSSNDTETPQVGEFETRGREEHEQQMEASGTTSEEAASLSQSSDTISKETEELTLEEENKRLKDARECKICMSNEIGVVFIPCGHLVTCVQCAWAMTTCCMCRSEIKGRVRTFLP
ncbi:death-associated inhibitor of apoptosis 2-like [Culicoides brevitarsis]|uniref:death-associated inhibitor of apoptosis 2-like n=1 Tax=Culicoides brevitarsis TaxID=469753 RepID=UPI00307C197B